jgi:uncharacterized Zn finger protein
MKDRRDRDGWPARTKPRKVADGIKAHSKRGAFAQRWWAKRWIAVLEGFGLGTRLTRGRAYARGGQVTQIVLEVGGVRALVQGSRAKPYSVTIRLREFAAGEWAAAGAAIDADARLSAMLLAGEMPEDIETAFTAAGVALFPRAANEMKTACSCPDWSNPCKHVAAVFYLVGEEFDRDPFLLFVIRGLERDAIATWLSAGTAARAPARSKRGRTTGPKGESEAAQPPAAKALDPVPLDAALFWTGAAGAPQRGDIAAPQADALLVKRAGRFPFWRADVSLEESVAPIYAQATAAALEWLAEHPVQSRSED